MVVLCLVICLCCFSFVASLCVYKKSYFFFFKLHLIIHAVDAPIKWLSNLYELVSCSRTSYFSPGEQTKLYQVRRICSGVPWADLKNAAIWISYLYNKVSDFTHLLKGNQQTRAIGTSLYILYFYLHFQR